MRTILRRHGVAGLMPALAREDRAIRARVRGRKEPGSLREKERAPIQTELK